MNKITKRVMIKRIVFFCFLTIISPACALAPCSDFSLSFSFLEQQRISFSNSYDYQQFLQKKLLHYLQEDDHKAMVATELYIESALSELEKYNQQYYFACTLASRDYLRKKIYPRVRHEGLSVLSQIIPLFVKDNTDVEGFTTQNGLSLFSLKKLQMAHVTAPLVQRLLERMPCIVFGKSSQPPFATGMNTRIKNALLNEHVSGGSSSGSAIVVSLAQQKKLQVRVYDGSKVCQHILRVLATGTDTGGSVRQPAAFNSVYAIKFSRKNKSYDILDDVSGIWPYSQAMDSFGLLASDVDLLKACSHIFTGYGISDMLRGDKPLKGMRIGIPDMLLYMEIDESIRKNFLQQLTLLQSLGAEIKWIEHFPTPLEIVSHYYPLIGGSDLLQNALTYLHIKGIKNRIIDLSHALDNLGRIASFSSRLGMQFILRYELDALAKFIHEKLNSVDVVLLPVSNFLPYKFLESPGAEAMVGSDALTIWANFIHAEVHVVPMRGLQGAATQVVHRGESHDLVHAITTSLIQKHLPEKSTVFFPERMRTSKTIPEAPAYLKLVYFYALTHEQRKDMVEQLLKKRKTPFEFLEYFWGRKFTTIQQFYQDDINKITFYAYYVLTHLSSPKQQDDIRERWKKELDDLLSADLTKDLIYTSFVDAFGYLDQDISHLIEASLF